MNPDGIDSSVELRFAQSVFYPLLYVAILELNPLKLLAITNYWTAFI
jgi:hypothetical protein